MKSTILRKKIKAEGIKFWVNNGKEEVGRAFLYLLKNDLHSEPFGLLEDVFVKEEEQKRGIGTKLVEEVIKEAKKRKCYKLIATSRYSRPQVHKWYKKLGFKDRGIEFRKDF
ncbi:MAG: Acetyltransferase (GNAT) family protein [Microgenomates group bacterium ADurb.Bin219]|nr:MAG: Acetyltransferase (GNAT) family protein [Microgenomates group bacterium ADurb.Bin219]HNP89104.1 GNAT family N-acetyltransferase [Candidatus Woesebacteria bacterium]